MSAPGVVEISYMAPSGPAAGPLADAVRVFEQESRDAHARDPARPVYRVILGETASNDASGDPTRFLVSVAGGEPPDVISFDRFAVSEWAARGAFEPLDGYIARDEAAHVPDAIHPQDFYRPGWEEVVYRDPRTGRSAVYGIPDGLDDRVLYYNKDLLKRAGYVDEHGEARPPRTWEELADIAVHLTERGDPRDPAHITRLGFAPNLGNAWLYLYGFGNGGRFLSADGRRCTFNDPAVVDALSWMTRVYDALGGAEQVTAFQSNLQMGDLDPFIQGQVAMKIDGSWILFGTLTQYGDRLDYGVAPPPIPAARLAAGDAPVSWVSGWCHAIPSTAHHKEAAWELIRFLNTWRATETINESTRQIHESNGRLFFPDIHANRLIDQALLAPLRGRQPGRSPRTAGRREHLPQPDRRLADPAGDSGGVQFMWSETRARH